VIKRVGSLDILLFILVVILVVFGVVMVFSASYYSTITEDLSPYYYLERAALWAVVGLGFMIIASLIPTHLYLKFAPGVMILAVVLLAALFVPGVGVEVNGATRWLGVGTLTFMPGEFTKLAAILFVAWYYTKYADVAKQFLRGFVCVMLLAGVLFALIYKEPNLSTALIIVFMIVAMMFLAGVPVGYLFLLVVAGVLGVLYLIRTEDGEHLSRITGFLDPFADAQGDFFQTVQGLIALGSGGLFGVGLGNSVEKALWLPYAHNDFIFAIIGEELGFVGCILLLIAFLVLIWRCMLISVRAKSRFDMLVGSGITSLMAIQVILNVGVVTSVLPPTGVILPFISHGGNAILLFMFLMGIMLNISRKDVAEPKGRIRAREAS
jgi:cell division protein FtsW